MNIIKAPSILMKLIQKTHIKFKDRTSRTLQIHQRKHEKFFSVERFFKNTLPQVFFNYIPVCKIIYQKY